MDRLDAWIISEQLVERLVNRHGLEEIDMRSSIQTSMITSTPVTNPLTKVDQHIDHILNVANWLLEGGEE